MQARGFSTQWAWREVILFPLSILSGLWAYLHLFPALFCPVFLHSSLQQLGVGTQPSLSCAALAPFLLWPVQEKEDLESQAEGPHRHSGLKDGERVGTCRPSSLTQLRGGGHVANTVCDSG